MTQEKTGATPEEKVVHAAQVWRDRDKAAIASGCNQAKRAEYRARQQLREAADLLATGDARRQ